MSRQMGNQYHGSGPGIFPHSVATSQHPEIRDLSQPRVEKDAQAKDHPSANPNDFARFGVHSGSDLSTWAPQ
jgi:hypothetical protein